VALNTVLGASAGVLGAVLTSWIVIKKPDLSMTLNGAIGGLVAITAAFAFVAPWAAILIGPVPGAMGPTRRSGCGRCLRLTDTRGWLQLQNVIAEGKTRTPCVVAFYVGSKALNECLVALSINPIAHI